VSCENADELSALLQLVLKESASRIPASAPIFNAAIEQHKANLANIESLESHSAKLVESRQFMSAERDAALAELEKLRAELAQYSAEMGLPPGRMWAPGVLKRWLEDLASARALFASGQCVDLAKVSDEEIGSAVSAHPVTNAEEGAFVRAALLAKAGVKL